MKLRIPVFQIFIMMALTALVSCGETTADKPEELPEQDTSIHYGKTNYALPVLSQKAKEQTVKWSVFEDFENEMRLINNANIETLLNSTERLVKYTDSLTKTVPDGLNDKAIISRMIVAKTKAGMLHQEIRLSRLDSTGIEQSIADLNTATHNLIVRMNEKFTKASIDEDRRENEEAELKKQQKFLDSVYQVELRDKNNN